VAHDSPSVALRLAHPATRNVTLVILAILVAVALALPIFANRFLVSVGVLLVLSAYVAASWNIVAGYAGQFSLAHAAFFGIGGYSSAWLYQRYGISPWLGMAIGAAVSALVATGLGLISFRYKLAGPYFAIATLAFAEIVRVLVNALPWFGQGSGVSIPLGEPGFWRLQFADPRIFYAIFVVMLAGIMALCFVIGRSRFGYRLACIRESETVAESLGIDVAREKLKAFVLSAALAAPAGTLYAQYLMFVDPATFFGLTLSITFILPALVGGAGTVFGPLCGAVLLTVATEIFNHAAPRPGVSLFAYGVVLMACVLFLPKGIWPSVRQFWERRS
jgi:branched-chain amino acid transport system permease protein